MPPKKDPRLDVNFLLNNEAARPPAGRAGPSRGRGGAHAQRRHSCPHCHASFAYAQDLAKHTSLVHEKPKTFRCDLCHKTFGEKGNLSKHKRSVHLNERPFKCSHCPKAFAFKDGLLRHINLVHLDQRPFVCKNCNMGFKQISQLRRHSASCGGGSSGTGGSRR